MRGCERDAGRKGLLRAEKRATRRDAARRGERRAYREAESGHGQRAAGNMQHECMRGALGNDIGIMAEHGTNEMTNGPTDWNRGPEIGAPSKEGHGVIIQANKGRSHQDYRVPRAAPHPVAPGPPLSLPPLPPCLSVITGPNCSPWHPLLSSGPLLFEEMPPASLLYVSFVSFHDNAPPFSFSSSPSLYPLAPSIRGHLRTHLADKRQLL